MIGAFRVNLWYTFNASMFCCVCMTPPKVRLNNVLMFLGICTFNTCHSCLPNIIWASSRENLILLHARLAWASGQSYKYICFVCFFSGYEGCSNMNASGFITFFRYMLQQNGKLFYKGLYVTFKLAPDLKKYTVYLSSYSLLKEGDVDILTNSMLRTYTSDIDERIILR